MVSLPITHKDIKKFKKEHAKPDTVKKIEPLFFNPELVEEGEAHQLLVQALDWEERKEDKSEEIKEYQEIEGRIPEAYFPVCIKHILKGNLPDGRKRALFALMNFLIMMNWSWEEIEDRVNKWNKDNSPPLKEGYVRTQLKWHRRQRRKFPPPNCGDYYYNLGLPVGSCKDHKNPVSYAVRRYKSKR